MESAENINDEQSYLMSLGELEEYNGSKVKTVVDLYGDREIIGQTVQLLAYIRHALRNNRKCEIRLKIGNTVANPDFMMDVNGFEIPDLVTCPEYQIN